MNKSFKSDLSLTFFFSGKIPGLHQIPNAACHKHQHKKTSRNIHDDASYVSMAYAFSWTVFVHINFGVVLAFWNFFKGFIYTVMLFHHILNTRSQLGRSTFEEYSNVGISQRPYNLKLLVCTFIRFFTVMKNYFLYSTSSFFQVFNQTSVGIYHWKALYTSVDVKHEMQH